MNPGSWFSVCTILFLARNQLTCRPEAFLSVIDIDDTMDKAVSEIHENFRLVGQEFFSVAFHPGNHP